MADERTIHVNSMNAPPPAKRQKTLVACKECKERKKKCDGIRPVCGTCSVKNPRRACVYTSERFRRVEDLEYVVSCRDIELQNLIFLLQDSFASTLVCSNICLHTSHCSRCDRLIRMSQVYPIVREQDQGAWECKRYGQRQGRNCTIPNSRHFSRSAESA